ncbi:TFIIB-type zinc ribbon-containing protein [Paracoccus xiamenensis]|uniref:TFIIB-type zinc ribbon-containing protein n=1 Tax=Paracoccus xiamenensis TaxID=2714901 RepID=UPI00140CD73B|nr:zf-TFIIB domain-containing protein [Paracoccus xiamenensis]NHF74061.1 hypothetical protein [Paracoccus xiamenensis]
MKCPVDDETLLMTQRDGVEIDYCPKCRGVWLDRGELDKIIEKCIGSATPAVPLTPPQGAQPAAVNQAPPQPQYQQPQYQQPQYQDRREPRYDDRQRYDDRRRYDDDDYYKGKRKKRESFLSELFDF